MNIAAQTIGFIALAVAILVFQNNDRRKMLYLQLLAALLFAIHFGLLGAWTGVAMNLIGGLRSAVFMRTQRRVWLYGFMIIFIVAGGVTWQSVYSILPIIGMLTGTIAFWMQSASWIRYHALISPPAWFVYNAIVGSYPGMIAEVLIFTSIIIGIERFDAPVRKARIARK